MKLKMIAAVAALALSAGAQADTSFDLGEISGSRPIGNSVVAGSFIDTFSFSLASLSKVTAVALNTSYFIDPAAISLGKISFFAASLDSVPLHSTITTTPLGPGVDQVMWQLSLSSPVLMLAGAHALTVHGVGDASGAQYTGSITVVPEPETYALMLAGLGALGFLARRRVNS